MVKRRRTNRDGEYVRIPARKPKRSRKMPRRRVVSSKRRSTRIKRSTNRMVKNVVDKVLACKDNIGIYTKTYTGELYSNNFIAQKKAQQTMFRLGSFSNPYDEYSMSFTPLGLKRIWDAASVLYSAKPKTMDIATTLGGNLPFKGLKIDVLYMSYHLEILNESNVPYHFELLEVTNKFTSNSPFLEVVEELHKGANWFKGIPFYSKNNAYTYDMSTDLQFGMIKGIESRYGIKTKVNKTILPGQKINYFIKEKKCIDMQKRLQLDGVDDPEVPSFAKGDIQLVFISEPVLHLVTNGSVYGPSQSNINTDPQHGLLARVTEVYKIIEPDGTLDEYQGDKRTILTDYGFPPFGDPPLPPALTDVYHYLGPSQTSYTGLA